MNTFVLDRKEDETGVSGTGIVAEGVEFSNGKCVLSWLTDFKSIAIYESIQDIIAIHCHGDKTQIIYNKTKPR